MCVHVYFVKVFQLCEVKIIFFLGIQNVMKICADIQSGALQWDWLKSKHSVLHVLETYSSKTQELSDFVVQQQKQHNLGHG